MNIYLESQKKQSTAKQGRVEDVAMTVFVAAFVGYVGFRIFFSMI